MLFLKWVMQKSAEVGKVFNELEHEANIANYKAQPQITFI